MRGKSARTSRNSVYGANTNMPFSVHNIEDHPLSLYATTERANELMARQFLLRQW